MLKNMIVTLVLLCSYLSLMIMFKQAGIEDVTNLIISSFALGVAIKIWVDHAIYLLTAVIFLSLLFAFMHDLNSIPFMLSSTLLGGFIVHLIRLQSASQAHLQRRPKNENREFLND